MAKLLYFKKGTTSLYNLDGYTFGIDGQDVSVRRGTGPNNEPYFVYAVPTLEHRGPGGVFKVGHRFRAYITSHSDIKIIEDNRVNCRPPASSDSESIIDSSELDFNVQEESEEIEETDEQIKIRINKRFKMLEKMACSAAQGSINGMVVYGAPGIGKSWGIENSIKDLYLLGKMSWDENDERRTQFTSEGTKVYKPTYRVVKGHVSAASLFGLLYEYSEKGELLIFDDCDSILQDEQALNLLKCALDSSEHRVLNWITQRPREDVPNSYSFNGSIIFITNVNFEQMVERGKSKLAPHLEAILSRCYYLDLTIDTTREIMLRIEQVSKDFKMLENMGLSVEQAEEVMQYVKDNADRFRELSVRTATKVGNIRRSQCDEEWKNCADYTCLKNSNKRLFR